MRECDIDYDHPSNHEKQIILALCEIDRLAMEECPDDMADESDTSDIDIVYRETPDGKHFIQVNIDIDNCEFKRYVDFELTRCEKYRDIPTLTKMRLRTLTMDDLLSIPDEEMKVLDKKKYNKCICAIRQALHDYFDGTVLSPEAPEDAITAYGVDRVEYALATMINRLPRDAEFDPELFKWAAGITSDVWETDSIDFDPLLLDAFVEYALEDFQGEREYMARDSVKYQDGKLDDPVKKRLYTIADGLDRIEITCGLNKYLDSGKNIDDNLDHYYNLLVARDFTEIDALINMASEHPTDSEQIKLVSKVVELLDAYRSGRPDEDQEPTKGLDDTFVDGRFYSSPEDKGRILAERIVRESNPDHYRDDVFFTEAALYAAMIGYVFHACKRCEWTFRTIKTLADQMVKKESVVDVMFREHGDKSDQQMYARFKEMAEEPHSQYVQDLLKWLDNKDHS